jgi:hypothetical protein
LDGTLRRVTIENSPTEDIKAEHKRWPSWSQVSAPPPISWTKCPKGCGRWLNAEKIQRHLKNCTGIHVVPPQKKTPNPFSNLKPEEINFDSCPLCGARLRAGRIQRHMSKAHRTSTSDPQFGELARDAKGDRRNATGTITAHPTASKPERERTPCPVCKVSVKAVHLKRHVAKVHRQRPAHSPTHPPSAKDPNRKDTTLVAARDKNLDATKPYAHPYREQGRYGSHPSHDGFDDESTAD